MRQTVTARRLTTAMASAGIKAAELARRAGVSKSSISQYVHGQNAPSQSSSEKLAAVLDVSPLWLRGFDVPMWREPAGMDLVQKYHALDPSDREKVDHLINGLLEGNKDVE